MKSIDVVRGNVILDPDRTHVLASPFRPMSDKRLIKITARAMALSENDVHTRLEGVRAEFGERQVKIDECLLRPFDQVCLYPLIGQILSEERKSLLGGYFTHEYSFDDAALFNPSMVRHLLRFIPSPRATAEGHVSSIDFRSGLEDSNGTIAMDVPSRYSLEPEQVTNAVFVKPLFERNSMELRLMGDFNKPVLDGLPESFTMAELHASMDHARKQLPALEQATAKTTAR